MKRIYYWSACVITIGILLYSCVQEAFDHDHHDNSEKWLSVEEARTFFENLTIQQFATRAGGKAGKPSRLGPGEFTPRWSMAKVSQKNNQGSVDIPILPQYRYRTIRSEFVNGKSHAYTVEISQKLIVVKDKKNGQLSPYILTLIPDRNFYAAHKGDISDLFTNMGDKGGFSGTALYFRINGNFPMVGSVYKDGKRIRSISLLKQAGLKKKITNLREILNQNHFQRKQSLETRSYGEDWWDYDDCYDDNPETDPWDWGDAEYLGKDDNGNDIWLGHSGDDDYVLVDYDGDGQPDSVLMDDANIPPPEEDVDMGEDIPPVVEDTDDNTSDNNGNEDDIIPDITDTPDTEETCPVCRLPLPDCICPKDDCNDTTRRNSEKVDKIYKDMENLSLLNTFINNHRNSSVEYGTVMNYNDSIGKFVMTDIQTNKSEDLSTMTYSYNDDKYSVASVHNHPGSLPPSITDIVCLAKVNFKTGGKFETLYVIGRNGTDYALCVEDQELCSGFYQKLKDDPDLIKNDLATKYGEIFAEMLRDDRFGRQNTYKEADLKPYAWAYVLANNNTGMALLVKENPAGQKKFSQLRIKKENNNGKIIFKRLICK